MKTTNELEDTIDRIAKRLIRTKQTIAVAESVTAGNIQAALSSAENAALFFQGGMTVYNIGQKCKQLDIDPILAESCNAVSQKIADQLSVNISRQFLSTYGMGITGYAAPFPEKGISEMFAYLSISKNAEVIASKKILAANDVALNVQLFYTEEILKLLLATMERE